MDLQGIPQAVAGIPCIIIDHHAAARRRGAPLSWSVNQIGEPARMSATNRNFVLAYALLVILPLVGLAGILKSGHRLKAPVSIDGVWNLRVDSAQLDALPCGKMIAATPDKAITISQSGTTFVLSIPSVPKMAASGILDGTTLQASLKPVESSSEGSCAMGQRLTLLANVDRRVDSSILTGTLSAANCPTCASVGFRAERQATAAPPNGGR